MFACSLTAIIVGWGAAIIPSRAAVVEFRLPTISLPSVEAGLPGVRYRPVSVALPPRMPKARMLPIWNCRCAFALKSYIPERRNRLDDVVAALGAAYRESAGLVMEVCDPLVQVGDYPGGWFGDYICAGRLVAERMSITDEALMNQIFQLLAESANGPDERVSDFLLGNEDKLTAEDYRREAGFTTRLSISFDGRLPLRVLIDSADGRMLVEAGEKWEVVTLDRLAGLALERLIPAFRQRATLP